MDVNANIQTELDHAGQMLFAQNYPQAELYLRRYLRFGGKDPIAHKLMADVARGYGVADTFKLSETSTPTANQKYLLIKAWGYGFWSDVHHVIGQLLLAELTQRTPIVHWGSNSLFGDGSGANAFELYFQALSPMNLADIPKTFSIYPPKWTHNNLIDENVNKWEGEHSRKAVQFFFNRDEDLVVSDFYMTVSSLIPWISPDSRYYGMSDDAIYLELFTTHLKPLPPIMQRVESFFEDNMVGRNWVAVHVRGSDKIYESAGLHQTNQQYFGFVNRIIEINPGIGVFLLTDSVSIHAEFSNRYGDQLVSTTVIRSDSTTGVHMLGHLGRTVGEDVLVDALLAARCDYFVGNQESNVSLAIASLKPWPRGLLFLLGNKNGRSENLFLHNTQPVDVQKCRLCQSPVQRQFSKKVLGKHDVNYHRCMGCGALQTDPPYWLDESYSGKAEMYDTGKATRTFINFLTLQPLLQALGVRKSDLAVDFGGGTGLLARLMRDAGYNFHTFDKFGSSEFMGGYAWDSMNHKCKVVTMYEIAEHFVDTDAEWERIFSCDPDWVIGTTSMYENQNSNWHYLSVESGQHIFFYAKYTVEYLANKAGRFAYIQDNYFFITRNPLNETTLALIQHWQNSLYASALTSLHHWTQGPYIRSSEDNVEIRTYASLHQSGKRIAIDGTFFRFASGISRVWKSLLANWSASLLAENLIVIDRGRTAPRLPCISYVDAPLYDYAYPEQDRQMLQGICDRENVGLFISTYYTIPLTTTSALLVLDLIPEVMGFDLTNPQWVGKQRAIEYASGFLSISRSTEQDLTRFYPSTQVKTRVVTYCGCDFRTATPEHVDSFKLRQGIKKPYFLISGTRGDYKNAILFFKAFELIGDRRSDYSIICTNANQPLEAELTAYVGDANVHMLVLSDADLQCAYSGAIALAYPSRYEGFGLPVAEAMACSCPVITCHNSSIPEVGGDAVIYVDPNNTSEMYQALIAVQVASQRAALITKGQEQAQLFSWTKMSREVGLHLAVWATPPA